MQFNGIDINKLKSNDWIKNYEDYLGKIKQIEFEEDHQIPPIVAIDSLAHIVDKRVISENKLKILEELMSMIEKHFIALNNKVLFREGKITKEQYDSDSGLDDKSYMKMRKLYKQFKSMD